ncbi:MAG: cytidine deaminase [Chloroflexota bacterium]|nr:cytidine deaminase [Chloroflexota bacterium]
MTDSPFPPDPAIAARRAGIVASLGGAFQERLAAARAAGGVDKAHPRAVIPAAVTADLVHDLGLEGVEEAMLLAIETACALARPPVSGYRVGAVGLAARSGDLVLGGNLELSGASIWQTVHGEGAVTLLARARGELVATLALAQARPCAHCRQVLSEMDGAHGSGGRAQGSGSGRGLRLIDPAGHDLRLADVYPWPFAPDDLGMTGAVAGGTAWPDLALAETTLPPEVADALLAAGRRSHAPYSATPAAIALRLADGGVVTGAVLESVAFNPTIGPAQDAFVGLLAAGHELEDIGAAWLAIPRAAQVGHEAAARDALAAAAPGSPLHVTYWS